MAEALDQRVRLDVLRLVDRPALRVPLDDDIAVGVADLPALLVELRLRAQAVLPVRLANLLEPLLEQRHLRADRRDRDGVLLGIVLRAAAGPR